MDAMPVGPKRRRRAVGGGADASPYDVIRGLILSGALGPGDQLVEMELAERCGVSRTPIREALTQLEQDGLVERVDRVLIVRESSPQEILDIYDTRIVLEARAAAVAAERCSEFEVVAMRRLAGVFVASAPDAERMAEANLNFHRAVWQTARNESLRDSLERLNLHLGRYPQTTLIAPGRHAQALDEHEHLIAAIESRDAELAGEIATKHFTHARDIRLKLWELPAKP